MHDSEDENTANRNHDYERARLLIDESIRLETEHHNLAERNRQKGQIMVQAAHAAYRRMAARSGGVEFEEEEFSGLSMNDNNRRMIAGNGGIDFFSLQHQLHSNSKSSEITHDAEIATGDTKKSAALLMLERSKIRQHDTVIAALTLLNNTLLLACKNIADETEFCRMIAHMNGFDSYAESYSDEESSSSSEQQDSTSDNNISATTMNNGIEVDEDDSNNEDHEQGMAVISGFKGHHQICTNNFR